MKNHSQKNRKLAFVPISLMAVLVVGAWMLNTPNTYPCQSNNIKSCIEIKHPTGTPISFLVQDTKNTDITVQKISKTKYTISKNPRLLTPAGRLWVVFVDEKGAIIKYAD